MGIKVITTKDSIKIFGNPNLKKAKEWLNSPEYAEVAKIRLENSVGTFVLLEGF